jgi:hypothetical protein
MISDSDLFVECDGCGERAEFSFGFVCQSLDWRRDGVFDGWDIDWPGRQGNARCPACKAKEAGCES